MISKHLEIIVSSKGIYKESKKHAVIVFYIGMLTLNVLENSGVFCVSGSGGSFVIRIDSDNFVARKTSSLSAGYSHFLKRCQYKNCLQPHKKRCMDTTMHNHLIAFEFW